MAVREQFKLQGAHFLSQSEADQLAKIVSTPQRSLNPAIVGKVRRSHYEDGRDHRAAGNRCLMADVGGVGRDFPLSMEKLSPILAFYVEDGLERGAARCNEILHYGGMGHTAGIHTRSREAAVRYGGRDAGFANYGEHADDSRRHWFFDCAAAVDDSGLRFVGR